MLDEYPEKAVREAVVNAIAHRDYGDWSRNIMVAVYYDRIVIASPGFPPKPLTIAKLMKGKYLPCSRNPVIAQTLASLNFMEQRGSGMGRMRAAMIDHGLDVPKIEMSDGYFQVILIGPGDDLKRLRVPQPTIESQTVFESFNERQRSMAAMLTEGQFLSSKKCQELFGVTRETVNRDFEVLLKANIATRKGKGRSTVYVYNSGN
jgi:predicted HTH transcriptional regulator